MEGLRKFLKVFIFVELGSCVGRMLWHYVDYRKRPWLYELTSDTWFSRAAPYVIVAAAVIVVTAAAYFLLGYAIKRRNGRQV